MLTAVQRITPSTSRWPLIPRWLGFSALLMAEASAVALRYTIPLFSRPVPWWLWPLDHLRAFLGPTALGLVATAYLSDTHSRPMEGQASRASSGWAGHGLALLGFLILTEELLGFGRLAGPDAAAWVGGWYAAGVGVLLSWLVLLGGDGWGALRRPGAWWPMMAGGLVFLGTCGLRSAASGSWSWLAWGTLALVRVALGMVTPALQYDPARFVVGTETFAVQIAPACSGYEGIGLTWSFLMVYLTVARQTLRWPHAWWLVPIGTLGIWLANVARITSLILIGSWWSPDVALGGFHSQAGSLAFLAVALGLVALSRSRWFVRSSAIAEVASTRATCPTLRSWLADNPTAAHLLPMLTLVATMMATGALLAGPGFDPLYPLRVGAGAWALAWCRRGIPGRLFGGGVWSVGAGLLVLAIWLILEPAATGPSSLGLDLAPLGQFGASAWLTFRVVGSVVIVPLAEEWAFRSYLTRRLIARDFESVPPGQFGWASFLVSSLLFGLLHGRWVAGTLAGLIYAGVYYRRGRVGDAALAHAVTNAGIAAIVLATGDGRYWS